MSALRLAPGLGLPLEAVTETFGWIGNRGSGKTYGAKVMAEEMLGAGGQVVVLDPVDAWYGLRFGRTRGSSGLPVYVFGGAHGDAPLEATAGALLADVVVEQGISAVLSLRHLPKGQQRRFVAQFAEQLYLRKGEEQYRSAVHVFIEEAHTFAPQQQMRGDDLRCLGAIQDLVLQGRGSGIGVSLITQRVATLSKAVLELAEVMCAFRTTGPNARDALERWFKAQDGEDHLQEFLAAIPGLPPGECFVWSPGFLSLFKRVAVREALTFDSSATPKGGRPLPKPAGRAAPLDLEALGDQIRATLERAKADDPKALRARIAELEAHEHHCPPPVATTVELEVPIVPPEVIEALSDTLETYDEVLARLRIARDALAAHLSETRARFPERPAPRGAPERPACTPAAAPAARQPLVRDAPRLSAGQQKILTALAQTKNGELPRRRLAVMVGFSDGAGHFSNLLGSLRSAGLIERGNPLRITDAGRLALGPVEEPPAGSELFDWWMCRNDVKGFGRPAKQMLLEIKGAWPESISRAKLAERMELQEGTGHFSNLLGRLRTLGLVEPSGDPRLDADFAEAIR